MKSTAQSELVAELRTHVADLREQLEQAHERDRENRRIIAALTQRMPELEAPGQEPPESPTEATEQPGRVGPCRPPSATVEGPQGSSERVSWWRRLFGG
jgi:anti-sigma-K factor RskA